MRNSPNLWCIEGSALNDIDESELIRLAKLAPPVPVEPEGKAHKVKGYTSLSEFLGVSGLKPGRNAEMTKDIYEVYFRWAKQPMPLSTFTKQLSKWFTKDDQGHFKYNMKVITLEEKMKSGPQEQEVSRSRSEE